MIDTTIEVLGASPHRIGCSLALTILSITSKLPENVRPSRFRTLSQARASHLYYYIILMTYYRYSSFFIHPPPMPPPPPPIRSGAVSENPYVGEIFRRRRHRLAKDAASLPPPVDPHRKIPAM